MKMGYVTRPRASSEQASASTSYLQLLSSVARVGLLASAEGSRPVFLRGVDVSESIVAAEAAAATGARSGMCVPPDMCESYESAEPRINKPLTDLLKGLACSTVDVVG